MQICFDSLTEDFGKLSVYSFYTQSMFFLDLDLDLDLMLFESLVKWF